MLAQQTLITHPSLLSHHALLSPFHNKSLSHLVSKQLSIPSDKIKQRKRLKASGGDKNAR